MNTDNGFEKWLQNYKNECDIKGHLVADLMCKECWNAAITWQREQYRKTSEYFTANYCEQLLEENKLLKERFKKYQADNLLEREQLIKELRRWIFVEYVPVFDRLVVDKDKLLAKLDLLEKGGE
jgi:hypothetical protein